MYFWPTLYLSIYSGVAITFKKQQNTKKRPIMQKRLENKQYLITGRSRRDFSIFSMLLSMHLSEAAQVPGDVPLLSKSSGLWGSLSRAFLLCSRST